MADDLQDTIRERAQGPAKVAVDGQVVEQQPLADQIAADHHLRNAAAVNRRGLGVVFRKLVPPGAG